ncbi:MAG: hypothetical protein M1836_003126 [Candelina mexicana]|nr:MAG: hypothetical protein M1836_003126 [Candelina mexicana]
MSDAVSIRSSGSSPQHHSSASHRNTSSITSLEDQGTGRDNPRSRQFDDVSRPDVIEEVSEPVSPESAPPSRRSTGSSVLTELLHQIPSSIEDSQEDSGQKCYGHGHRSINVPSLVVEGTTSPLPSERTPLLPKSLASQSCNRYRNDHSEDLQGQAGKIIGPWNIAYRLATLSRERGPVLMRSLANPKSWNPTLIWRYGLVEPARYIPAVFLGLLLNILDALSYGRWLLDAGINSKLILLLGLILFPLGEPLFSNLGPDGMSMFYVSTIIAQLVYSGISIFRCSFGSEMIEVVPFFHKMALTILATIGEDNPKSVLATTVVAFSISSILTGIIFFLMGACKLGSLTGFFPRHILIGCIGGVGWFLVATGLEVSARLDGNLEYNLATLSKLLQVNTIFLWLIPLVLAIIKLVASIWVTSPFFTPAYFMAIPAVFYFFIAAIPELDLGDLRALGWMFPTPDSDVPFYHFYTLYGRSLNHTLRSFKAKAVATDFAAVDWNALAKTIPAMFALTFFGVLHVPINIPALGVETREDNMDVNRELIAHGISNTLSGLAGSIQNYLVYTNSILFYRSGGDSRVAGVLLAIGTFGILIAGPVIIGYIPVTTVGALIFMLGFELLQDALYKTWGKLHKLEYLTILIIVVTMGAWDFVIGILIGIILACVNFVVQTSQKSAIRATHNGQIAGSTVRRHPVQQRYLGEAGRQTHVLKLTGYLFFGTVVSVENRIRELLGDEAFNKTPLRFVVFDLAYVTGLDYSASEAFTRLNRILWAKNVQMIMCGVNSMDEIGRNLRSVGLFDEGDVQIFSDLNSALEYSENELLKTFYARRDALTASRNIRPRSFDVLKNDSRSSSHEIFSSPRQHHLHQLANTTLSEHDNHQSSKWQDFKQPLPLILQTFQGSTDKSEDFWFRITPYFERKTFRAGAVLYKRGDPSTGFYLLEEGIFRATYELPQGNYYESIVAGTTCGELPFFSQTEHTATVIAERDSVAWLLNEDNWRKVRKEHPDVVHDIMQIGLKLTTERFNAITS